MRRVSTALEWFELTPTDSVLGRGEGWGRDYFEAFQRERFDRPARARAARQAIQPGRVERTVRP